MGYPKNLGSPGLPGYAHAPFSPKFLMGFSSDASYECRLPATFEVRSLLALPVPELTGGGGWVATSQKLVRSLAMPTLSILAPPQKKSYAYRTDYLSLCTRFPAILDCSFEWGLRTPNLGKGKVVGGRGRGWHCSKVLVSSYSNFSSIFPRFRDIAAFVLQHATFPYPISSPPPKKNPHVPLGISGSHFCYKERRCWANCAISFQD